VQRQRQTAENPVLHAGQHALEEESAMRSVRVWFQKIGAARYISHLDLSRCIARAAQRAKIPLWYTKGFNTHAYLTFALPLSLGFYGLRESFDFRIEGEISNEEIKERLKKALPRDLPILDVTEPVMKSSAITFASYEIKIDCDNPDELSEQFQNMMKKEHLVVPKHTKSGWIDLDIRPEIQKFLIKKTETGILIDVLLPAGNQFNLNPSLILTCAEKEFSFSKQAEIVRTELYDSSFKRFV
jgi:radical SAM-linked protein